MKPEVVLAADEMERAAVEPGDDQRAIVTEGTVDVGCVQPPRARPHSQAKTTLILSLHRQQPFRDGVRVTRRRTREQLR